MNAKRLATSSFLNSKISRFVSDRTFTRAGIFPAEGGAFQRREGSLPAISSVTPSGITYVDYVDSGTMWGVNLFTYSFPTSSSFYTGFNGGAYGSGEQNTGFQAFNAVQQAATASILNMYSAVANVTFTQIAETSTQSADLRYARVESTEHGLGLLSFGLAGRWRCLVQQFERLVRQSRCRQLCLADHHPRDRASARAQTSARRLGFVRRSTGQRRLRWNTR